MVREMVAELRFPARRNPLKDVLCLSGQLDPPDATRTWSDGSEARLPAASAGSKGLPQ
jgi:hypothetical protein